MSKPQPLLAVALLCALALSGTPASAFVRRPSGITADALVAAMNRERAAHRLKPLLVNHALTLAASDRVNDMFAKHYFAHTSPDGIDPFTWADARGYDYTAIGENLATGYRTADDVVASWMQSEHHRENVLNKEFREIGVATAAASPARGLSGPLVVALYGSR